MSDLSLKYLLFGEDRTASKSIRGVADTAEQSSGRFASASKAWQAGAALAGAAVVKFGIDTVMAASDQNEVVSKTTVVFGDNASQIIDWASTADKSMGLSKTAALEAASGFGDMFLQLGFARGQATNMAQAVVGLAADLGSFNNLPTAEVADMISAAFRGEYDSLQRLVPNINAARVETQALAMTGKTNARELTAQEKAAATLAIITKDSARAQGDFARTSDGLANSLKIAQAEATNAAADLGQKLLPAVTAVVQGFTGAIGAVGNVVDTMSQVPPPVYGAVAAMTAWNLVGDRVEATGRRVMGSARGVGDSIRLAGLYAREAGGGMNGLRAGVGVLTGGLTAGKAAMSGFKAVGSGLMSLAGGPWGLAVAALTAAVTGFIQAQKNAEAAASSLADTMDRQTGSFTKASQTTVVEAIMGDLSADDVKLLQDLGISLREGADAALEGGPKLEAYNQKVKAVTGETGAAWKAADGYLSSLENQNEVADQAKTKNATLAKEGIKPVGEAADDATGSGDLFAGALDAVADAAGGAKVDIAAVNRELTEFYGRNVDAEQAAVDYEQAVDDATAAVKENGRTLDINTSKGRANKSALLDLAKAAVGQSRSMLESGRSVDATGKQMDVARAKFIKIATQMNGGNRRAAEEMATKFGLTRGAVQAMNGEINKTPPAKKTNITVPTAVPTGQARRIRAEIADIKGKSVPVTIHVFGLGPLRAAQGLLSGIQGVAGSLNFGRNARGTSNWRGGLTWVGEEGPELVNLPGGAQVYDANRSAAMVAGGAGGGVTYVTVNLRAPDGRVMQTELLKLKRQTGGELGLG